MSEEKSLKLGNILKLLLRLDGEKVSSTKMIIALLAIAGMPGINSEGLARVCGTNKRGGFTFASILVKKGLVQIIDIPKTEIVRGRRVAGFHLTELGESLIN